MFGKIKKDLLSIKDELVKVNVALIDELDKTNAMQRGELKKELDSNICLHDVNIENKLKEYDNKIEEKLIKFHKEITDKCFSSMENIMRYTKEVSLIESLAKKMNSQDLNALEAMLMRPVLENKWNKEREEQSDNVTDTVHSIGSKIVQERKKLYDDYLVKNRTNQDTKDLELQLKVFDFIIGGMKGEEIKDGA